MNESEFTPSKNELEPTRQFAIGDEVKVARTVYDENGKRTAGRVIEDGWEVISIEETVDGKFITTQPIGDVEGLIGTKRYSANKLADIQRQGEVPQAPDAPELAASRNILALTELPSSPEREAEVEHIQEEMAEVALGDAAIDDPNDVEAKPEEGADKVQLEQYLADAKIRHDALTSIVREKIATDIGRSAGRIDDAGAMINVANSLTRSLDNDRAELLRVVGGIENGSYGNDAARTLLHNISENLQGTYVRLRNVGENSIPDIQRAIAALSESLNEAEAELRHNDGAFNQHAEELIENNPDAGLSVEAVNSEAEKTAMKAIEEPLMAIVNAMGAVDAEVAENAQAVRVITNQIEEIHRLSYSGVVDVDTIRTLAARLSNTAENSQRLNMFSNVLSETVSDLRGSAARLNAE